MSLKYLKEKLEKGLEAIPNPNGIDDIMDPEKLTDIARDVVGLSKTNLRVMERLEKCRSVGEVFQEFAPDAAKGMVLQMRKKKFLVVTLIIPMMRPLAYLYTTIQGVIMLMETQ